MRARRLGKLGHRLLGFEAGVLLVTPLVTTASERPRKSLPKRAWASPNCRDEGAFRRFISQLLFQRGLTNFRSRVGCSSFLGTCGDRNAMLEDHLAPQPAGDDY